MVSLLALTMENHCKISLLELQIQRREEEARYRNEGLEKDRLLVQIERDKLALKKLQNDEEESKTI